MKQVDQRIKSLAHLRPLQFPKVIDAMLILYLPNNAPVFPTIPEYHYDMTQFDIDLALSLQKIINLSTDKIISASPSVLPKVIMLILYLPNNAPVLTYHTWSII